VNSRDPAQDDVESAIERVLAAEAAAGAAVQLSRAEAQSQLESARARARRISERAGERLQRLTLRIEAASLREVEALGQCPPQHERLNDDDLVHMQRLVEAIAAQLTGESP